MSGALLIGSRGSKLALWQANWVQRALQEHGHDARIEVIKTTGDRITHVLLAKVGTKGLFTKEIDEALIDGHIHLAVHSLKDLPTELPGGLALAAVPRREDPRDALVSRNGARLDELPRGARVGTSSLRRTAQLLNRRPDLRIEPLRGNLDTRLRKLDEGALDAIVLAAAGLKRMGWDARITQLFEPDVMCPAVGQGALAIEARAADSAAAAALVKLDDAVARAETAAERALLAALGGGCQVPIGALARAGSGGRVSLHAVVASPDGRGIVRASGESTNPAELSSQIAAELLREGARRILDEVYGRPAPVAETP